MGSAGLPVLVVGGALGFIALVSILMMFVRRAQIVAVLRNDDALLEELRLDPRSPIARAVKEHVVVSLEGGKRVLSKSLSALRREYAEAEVAHAWSFWLGGLLTGAALIVTFVLIALVMTNEVSGAISESVGADEHASTNHLAEAVSLLGGKFYISAAGVLASVLSLFIGNLIRGDIYRRADHPTASLNAMFMSAEEYEVDLRHQELALMNAERKSSSTQHEQICEHFAALRGGVDRLSSIEVSVKTIGNEVSANLKNIMKDAMGEELKELFSNVMADVSEIADNVSKTLMSSFSSEFQRLSAELRESLTALKTTIEGQSQGQLEKILGQLRNAVSGGFHNESTKMVAALEGFARVVPALEAQLREMTGKVAEDSKKRGEESAAISSQLMDQMRLVLDKMNAQQEANAHAIERMQKASEQGAEEMARRLEQSGSNVVNNVLGSSRKEIEAIVGQLRTAAEASSGRYGQMETQAGNAAAAIRSASEALVQSARSISEVSNQASSLVGQSKASSEAIITASRLFTDAGTALLRSGTQIQHIIETASAQTREQAQLLAQQRQYTTEVEKLWPELFNKYLEQFKRSSDELSRSWDAFYTKVASLSGAVGGDFAESTGILSESVDRLVKLAENGRATR